MVKQFVWENSFEPCTQSYIWPVIKSLLPQGQLRIVDLGCGNGSLSGKLSGLGYEMTALDASEEGIQIGKKHYPDVRFFCRSIYDDVSDIGKNFDLVISTEVIEHLYDPSELINKAFLLLKPGGCFILTTPYHGYFKNLALSLFDKWDTHHSPLSVGGHIKFFSKATLSKILIEGGFSQISFSYAGRTPIIAKSMVVRAVKNV